eukprot:g3180.t1
MASVQFAASYHSTTKSNTPTFKKTSFRTPEKNEPFDIEERNDPKEPSEQSFSETKGTITPQPKTPKPLFQEDTSGEETLPPENEAENKRNIIEQSSKPLSQGKGLIIGINTVSRKNNLPYLAQTLECIWEEIKEETTVNLKVVVVHVNPDQEHMVFEQVRSEYTHEKYRNIFHFEDSDARSKFSEYSNSGMKIVEKQTLDLASLLQSDHVCGSPTQDEYFMFLEDDMRLCPRALTAIKDLLLKADTYDQNWLAIRTSFGMNGIFLHCRDVIRFSDYLHKEYTRRPPDHLVVEWYKQESDRPGLSSETIQAILQNDGRESFFYKFNLFEHLGTFSSLRNGQHWAFPICYERLQPPVVFESETYRPDLCPLDDITPCPEPISKDFLKDHPLVDYDTLKQQIPMMNENNR